MIAHESIAAMTHRRDILRGCLRGAALLALGGIAASLGWRGRRGPCQRAAPCGGCPLVDGCDLPKALEAKSRIPPDARNRVPIPTFPHV